MRHHLLVCCQRLAFAAVLVAMTVSLDRSAVFASQAKGQAPQAPPQEEKKDADKLLKLSRMILWCRFIKHSTQKRLRS